VFAITGWPPFGVFISEFTIVSAGFAAGAVVPSLLFIGAVTAIFAGFIFHAAGMVFGEPRRPVTRGDADVASLALLGLLLALLLVLGVFLPSQLEQCIHNAAAVLKGGGV